MTVALHRSMILRLWDGLIMAGTIPAAALTGDLFESYLKRQFKVKDSNEILIKNPVFAKLELLVGGSEGHGGFLDRIDSTAFTSAMLLVISLFI